MNTQTNPFTYDWWATHGRSLREVAITITDLRERKITDEEIAIMANQSIGWVKRHAMPGTFAVKRDKESKLMSKPQIKTSSLVTPRQIDAALKSTTKKTRELPKKLLSDLSPAREIAKEIFKKREGSGFTDEELKGKGILGWQSQKRS